MKFTSLIALALFIIAPVLLTARTSPPDSLREVESRLSSTQQFLASPALEGRETGTRGNELAAEYLASCMMKSGLKPYLHKDKTAYIRLEDYFQKFQLERYSIQNAEIISSNPKKVFNSGKADFIVEYASSSISGEYPFVFAGFGISLPDKGYDSFKGADMKGKIVVLLDGYPEADTTTASGSLFRGLAKDDSFDADQRIDAAQKHGAVAVIFLNHTSLQEGKRKEEQGCPEDKPYQDAGYQLPGSKPEHLIPGIFMSETGSRELAEALLISKNVVSGLANGQLIPCITGGKKVRISISIIKDTIVVSNLLGFIGGKDTNITIIAGAHYDHLGKRGNLTYYGSDDNASGVSGLMELIRQFSEQKPTFNLLFACWTAEEKGLLGSEYFASTINKSQGIRMYVNMDMISRSAPEDGQHRTVSVGTRTVDDHLRKMVSRLNNDLPGPFSLDLWDVTGHHGSDYASFLPVGIPVMTFFSGFHNEYHTPCDTPDKADLSKMAGILALVKQCILHCRE